MFVVFTSRLVTFCVRKKTPKLRDIKTRFEEEEEDKDKDKEGKTFGEEERTQSGLAFWCRCSLVLFFFARGNESLDDKKHHHIHRLISTFIKAIKEEAKR